MKKHRNAAEEPVFLAPGLALCLFNVQAFNRRQAVVMLHPC